MSEEAQPAGIVPRPLELDPERAGRAGRAPYAIIDIGSNSVRLVVYDQLGRAPLPRFNEKSLCRLGEGLAQTGAINADGFRRTIEALRRFRAIADAMGVANSTSRGPKRSAALQRAGARDGHPGRDRPRGPYPERGGRARFAALGVILRLLSSNRDCRRHGRRPSKSPKRWTITSAIVGLVRPLPLCGGGDVPRASEARASDRRHPARGLAPSLVNPGSTRSAADGVHWRTRTCEPATCPCKSFKAIRLALRKLESPSRCCGSRRRNSPRPGGWPIAGRELCRGGDGAGSLVESPRLGAHRVLALGLREGLRYSQLGKSEQYLDPLIEGAQLIGLPLSRVPDFAAALVPWTANSFPAIRPRRPGCGSRPARCQTSRGAICRICAPRRAFAVCCNFRSSASIIRSGLISRRRPCALCRPARRALAQPGDRPADALGAQSRADSRPRDSGGLSLFRRRARRARGRPPSDRGGLRAARSRRRRARSRQRSRRRAPQAARRCDWSPAKRNRRDRRGALMWTRGDARNKGFNSTAELYQSPTDRARSTSRARFRRRMVSARSGRDAKRRA